MYGIFFKYLKSYTFKDRKTAGRLSVAIIILLLILQTVVTFTVCRQSDIAYYLNIISQKISSQEANEESRMLTLSSLAATIASDGDILRISDMESPNYLELSGVCSTIRKYMSISYAVSNIYVYNNTYKYVFDSRANVYKTESDERIKEIKKGIDAYFESGEMFFMFSSKKKISTVTGCHIFQTDPQKGDLIIIEDKSDIIFDDYENIQGDTKSSLIVTTLGGDVIYGGGEYPFLKNISNTEVFKASLKKGNSGIVTYNGEKYIVCYSSSEYTKRKYIALTPKKNVTADNAVGKNYIYLYICIILSILILLRTLSIWKKLSSLLIRQTVSTLKKKRNAKDDEYIYSEYGYPSENGNKKLEKYLKYNFGEYPYVTVVLLKIDNYDEVQNQYSVSDINLIKYGIKNICSEIFENNGLMIKPAENSSDRIEFVVGLKSKQDKKAVNDAIYKCMKSIDNYIGFKLSGFIGSVDVYGSIYECYVSAHNTLQYAFIYGNGTVLDDSCIVSLTDEKMSEAKTLCNVMKENIKDNSEKYFNNIEKLKNISREMSPAQIYEILCYLLFNICVAVKDVEIRLKMDTTVDIAECFKILSQAPYSEKVFETATAVFCELQDKIGDKGISKHSKLVKDCDDIIKANYSDQTLCIDYIAQRLGLSGNYLGRVYKQEAGVSLSVKITEIRLEKAAELLIETKDKVTNIAESVGFVNVSHFTVLFKQRFGESPLNYRRNHYKL